MVQRRDVLKMGAGATLAVGLLPGLGASKMHEGTHGFYLAGLTGDQGPEPVETKASGGALFSVSEDGQEVHYTLSVNALENLEQVHIHRGGPDESGSVVVPLYPTDETSGSQSGRVDGTVADSSFTADALTGPLEGKTIEDLLQLFEEGDAYVNVHTKQNPAGEIRGQILSAGAVADCVSQMQGQMTTEAETTEAAETETEEPAAETETTSY